MGTCPIGYHVKDASVVGYVHTYVNGSYLQCVRCTVDDGVTCDQTCQPGRSSLAPALAPPPWPLCRSTDAPPQAGTA
jgi:hypothetical protein